VPSKPPAKVNTLEWAVNPALLKQFAEAIGSGSGDMGNVVVTFDLSKTGKASAGPARGEGRHGPPPRPEHQAAGRGADRGADAGRAGRAQVGRLPRAEKRGAGRTTTRKEQHVPDHRPRPQGAARDVRGAQGAVRRAPGEVMVHGKPRAIVTVESSSGRIATVEWAEADFPTAKIVKVATAAVALMRLVEPAAAAA
jgi:hypothetical protein